MRKTLLIFLLIAAQLAATAQTYVDLTSTQTITGVKTFSNTLYSNNIYPTSNNSANLGTSANRYATIYGTHFLGIAAGTTYGTNSANTLFNFRQGGASTHIVAAVGSNGRWFFQPPGAAPPDSADYQVYVDGSTKIAGGLNVSNLPIYMDNAAAVASGAKIHSLYKTLNNDVRIVVREVPFSTVNNNTTRTIHGTQYLSQNANPVSPGLKPWAMNKSVGGNTMRMEVRPNDNWSGDGSGKNRSELKAVADGIEFDTTMWISFSMLIEPGPALAIDTTLGQIFFLMQVHASEDPGDVATGPVLSLTLDGLDNVSIRTTSTTAATHTSSPAAKNRASVVHTRGQWFSHVIKTKFTKGTNTILQWWVNGNEIINHVNLYGIGYNDTNPPYFKFGTYRTEMPQTTAVRYANVKIQRNGASGPLQAEILSPAPID